MNELIPVQNKIFDIRGQKVMLDRDLAQLYGVETRVLNQAVRRNIERFPDDFMFQLSNDEFEDWKSQIVMSNSVKMGLRRLPFAFTELGVAMLSSVLNSKTAIQINDINEDTRVHLKLINETLAKLQEKKSQPRRRIGYKTED